MSNIYKSSHVLLIFITLNMLLSSCEPKVLFKEAAPPEIEKINRIPDNFLGVFLCESDSSKMYAEPFIVYNESYHMIITSVEKIRETEDCSILAGGLYLPGRKECIPFEYIGKDSIMAKVYTIDTLFNFRENEVLKLYKGRLFLNYKSGYDEWVTFMITPLEYGALEWEVIDIPDKISKVEAITHDYVVKRDRDDEERYIIKPSLIEFDKILEKEYTRECDILFPVYHLN